MDKIAYKFTGRTRSTFDPVEYVKKQREKHKRIKFKLPEDEEETSRSRKKVDKSSFFSSDRSPRLCSDSRLSVLNNFFISGSR